MSVAIVVSATLEADTPIFGVDTTRLHIIEITITLTTSGIVTSTIVEKRLNIIYDFHRFINYNQ